MGRVLGELKLAMNVEIGHKLGTKYDMEIDQIKLLKSAYDNIIEQQYTNAIPHFEALSLEDYPKQCFIVASCSSNKPKATPINLLSHDECVTMYSEEQCADRYIGSVSGDQPANTMGAPLLCAENGSVAYRGLLSDVDEETGHYIFATGDYHLLAMAVSQDWAHQDI